MCAAFGVCCLGMLGGLVHGFYATFYQRRTLEDVLGHSIPYYQFLGAIGITGLLLFLAFLVSSISNTNKRTNSK
jgi:hypothetical protein